MEKPYLLCRFYGRRRGGGAVANLCLNNDSPQKRDFFNDTIMVIGLTIAALRYQRMVIYSRLGIQIAIGISASRENHLKSDNVIDTSPEQSETTKQRNAAKAYFGHTGWWGSCYLIGTVARPFIMIHDYPDISFKELLIATGVLASFAGEGGSMLYRAFKVAKGDWHIIDKDKMEPETEMQASPSLVPQPIQR